MYQNHFERGSKFKASSWVRFHIDQWFAQRNVVFFIPSYIFFQISIFLQKFSSNLSHFTDVPFSLMWEWMNEVGCHLYPVQHERSCKIFSKEITTSHKLSFCDILNILEELGYLPNRFLLKPTPEDHSLFALQ